MAEKSGPDEKRGIRPHPEGEVGGLQVGGLGGEGSYHK